MKNGVEKFIDKIDIIATSLISLQKSKADQA